MEHPKSDPILEKKQHDTCLRMVHNALTTNEVIGKIVGEIEELGCSIPDNFFLCKQELGAHKRNLGGFAVPSGGDEVYTPAIVLFENNITDKDELESTLRHELIHAYDICKGKVDYKNCLHHACTEVRASNLSGECAAFQELLRGHFTLTGGKMECVKRRAALSVEANPYCKGASQAAVEKVFETAYKDISPLNDLDLWKTK